MGDLNGRADCHHWLGIIGLVFSLEAACDHLQALEDDSLTEAVRYIEKAPIATNTKLRRHLRDDPWWQEQVERVMAG